MSNNKSKSPLLRRVTLTVAAGCIVCMAISTARSIAKILREPVPPPPVMAPPDTPAQDLVRNQAGMQTPGAAAPAPLFPEATAAPPQQRKPSKKNTTPDFEQIIQAEQERKQSYQILREQAQANPGQLGALTEDAIRKLEKDGETGDSGYP
jgi:hypothetical protein